MKSIATAGLPLFSPQPCQHIETRLRELLAVLRDRQWHTAKQLAVHGFNARELRDLVEHDERGDVFSFPGSPGYKLFDAATIEEIGQSRALLNAGKRQIHRFIRYQRRFHNGR